VSDVSSRQPKISLKLKFLLNICKLGSCIQGIVKIYYNFYQKMYSYFNSDFIFHMKQAMLITEILLKLTRYFCLTITFNYCKLIMYNC
jgi:hypothetical protein